MNRRPQSLRRKFGRWLLIRRARRIKFEREMAEITDLLERIRQSKDYKQLRKIYADEVD